MSVLDQSIELAILSAGEEMLGEMSVLEEGLLKEGGLKFGLREAGVLWFSYRG